MKLGIFIFRRDFRTYDNTALIKCHKECDVIYPIFIFTPEQVGLKNSYRSLNAVRFMMESLEELNQTYLDGNLNIFYDNYMDVIKSLVEEFGDDTVKIYTNTDYSPYGLKRDIKIRKYCDSGRMERERPKGETEPIEFYAGHDVILFEPMSILNQKGGVYQKFTPFYNKVLGFTFPKVDGTRVNKSKFRKLSGKGISWAKIRNIIGFKDKGDQLAEEPNRVGGRKAGLKILSNLSNFKNYDETRNLLAMETTELSAYLKFGCLSIREVLHKMIGTLGVRGGLVRQLIWREFYYHVGYGFQVQLNKGGSIKPDYDKIKWKGKAGTLQKWKDGETGFPIVDACMRQINRSGYMHNRGRLIVASFLIKNLLHDWRKGEKYFSQRLMDIDWLVNNGNWQWVAGSGTDSQPYFRIFNPWSQSEKFDPDAEYIKRWLPQLAKVPAKHLHHWEDYYHQYDLKKLGYYAPIIDYKKSRELALEMYKKAFN